MTQENTKSNPPTESEAPASLSDAISELEKLSEELQRDIAFISQASIKPHGSADFDPLGNPLHRLEARVMYECRHLRLDLAQFQLSILKQMQTNAAVKGIGDG